MEAVYRLVDWENLPTRVKVGISLMRNPLANWLMLGLGNFFIKKALPNGIQRKLTTEEMAEYARPYPTLKSRRPIRIWPREIPIHGAPQHTYAVVSAYHHWLLGTPIPKLCLYADPGLLIPKREIPWIKQNFLNIKTVEVGKGLHFIQEDRPHEIGSALADWFLQLD